MPLTILTDAQIRSLLHSLTLDDVQRLQQNLASALHDYSTGTQETTAACSANQPNRIAISSVHGTTLFMPATTGSATGVKIVSLSTPPPSKPEPGPDGGGSGGSSSSLSPTASQPSIASSQSTTPRGSLTLLDPSGLPVGFLNAEELTAFRTALASTFLFSKRNRVRTVTVFGAGKQAYWAIRLALLLRGSQIHRVHIINRTFAGAEPLLRTIYNDAAWDGLRDANPKLVFSVLSREYGEYGRLLKQRVRDADAIFMCTPSTAPLFPAEHLTSPEGRRKGRYVSLVGSYRPHMTELHPDVLRHAVAPADHARHFHKHAERSGVVVVDGLAACLQEAGEVIAAGLSGDQLVELGELVMVRRAERKEVELGGARESGLRRWLEAGLVVYKSVGLGIMDVCVGGDIVDLARERGVGTTVDDF